jgi:hypothetical protein
MTRQDPSGAPPRTAAPACTRRGALPILVVGLVGAVLVACALPGRTVMKSDALSPTFAPMVYKEEGDLVLMTVSVNATRFHEDDPFIPLEIWLANKGIEPKLKIDRESFYLMDTIGRRYGLAGHEEVRRLQRGLSQDKRISGISDARTLGECLAQAETVGLKFRDGARSKCRRDSQEISTLGFNLTKFDPYSFIYTNFFPLTGTGLIDDRADLPRFTYMADLLYFPRPEGELRGGIFELHLTAEGLPEDVLVVFEVPR